MKDLNKKALAGLLQAFAIFAAALFLPAWTVNYWQAWIFLAVFYLMMLAITLYLMKNDPKLLARRSRGGPSAEEKRQKLIHYLMAA